MDRIPRNILHHPDAPFIVPYMGAGVNRLNVADLLYHGIMVYRLRLFSCHEYSTARFT